MQVGVKANRKGGVVPEYGTERSACADLRGSLDYPESVKILEATNTEAIPRIVVHRPYKFLLVPPQGRALIPTGLIFDIPEGYSLRVHPRSGLSFKLGLTVVCGEGVIDEDYQNELFVPVINHS